jgi:hypothetical protein
MVLWNFRCNSVFRDESPATKTLPPSPPSPPLGPPRGLDFSRRKLTQPFPPFPALIFSLTVSIIIEDVIITVIVELRSGQSDLLTWEGFVDNYSILARKRGNGGG